ncbi:hypothetical protein FEM48_Zijuj04G0197300 [Ziziphus jujuba var. spinosa]|uniref:Uncharacterized protein n=1 Tax=Ziziphus jujuba var. spinosa TaxID=714518 RepID=A0A978VLU0_ZIZJJ|nr:hypothetical protein FEM48_Zijuj04G0197300 [Ziziphus jujuba var. spinosa]
MPLPSHALLSFKFQSTKTANGSWKCKLTATSVKERRRKRLAWGVVHFTPWILFDITPKSSLFMFRTGVQPHQPTDRGERSNSPRTLIFFIYPPESLLKRSEETKVQDGSGVEETPDSEGAVQEDRESASEQCPELEEAAEADQAAQFYTEAQVYKLSLR